MNLFGMMAACSYAFAAVNTKLACNACPAIADPDGFCRTSLYAVNASFAKIFVKVYRMKEFI
jgi:hypothetical protein